MLKFAERFIPLCRKKSPRIVFTEPADKRALEAARYLFDRRLARPLLLGTPSEIRDFAAQNKISTQGLTIRHPLHDPGFYGFTKELSQARQAHGVTRSDAEELLRNPVNMGMWLVRAGEADVCFSGNIERTDVVLRSAMRIAGMKPGVRTASGFYLMIAPDEQRQLLFADCVVTPRPSPDQLAETAIQSAENFMKLTGVIPKVAMLSFSTGGSAKHEMTDKVRDAVLLAQKKKPSLIIDGEVQFDAAIVPEIAGQKAPNCRLQGQANVFIFPSLNAADSARKILKELAGYTAIGPFIQGLNGKVTSLSQICTTKEMINVALVSSGL